MLCFAFCFVQLLNVEFPIEQCALFRYQHQMTLWHQHKATMPRYFFESKCKIISLNRYTLFLENIVQILCALYRLNFDIFHRYRILGTIWHTNIVRWQMNFLICFDERWNTFCVITQRILQPVHLVNCWPNYHTFNKINWLRFTHLIAKSPAGAIGSVRNGFGNAASRIIYFISGRR